MILVPGQSLRFSTHQSCADAHNNASTCIISSNTLTTGGCLLLHLPESSSHQVGWCPLQPLVKTNSHFQPAWRFDGILRGETWRERTEWVICTFSWCASECVTAQNYTVGMLTWLAPTPATVEVVGPLQEARLVARPGQSWGWTPTTEIWSEGGEVSRFLFPEQEQFSTVRSVIAVCCSTVKRAGKR